MAKKPKTDLRLSKADTALVEKLVQKYISQTSVVTAFHKSLILYLEESSKLEALCHSFRHRIKDPDHLRDKLQRKILTAKRDKAKFDINETNLLRRINDLSGVRILHLHSKQFEKIDAEIKQIVSDQNLALIEGPIAKTWDDEAREYFRKIGVQTETDLGMYTSVHYVIQSNSKEIVTSELQVRTLMEEVWGEVNHRINYPHSSSNVLCTEQIRTLARLTSATSRLVDSVFLSTNYSLSEIPSASKKAK